MYEELEQVAWDLKAAQMEAGVDFPVHLSREAGGMVSKFSEEERYWNDHRRICSPTAYYFFIYGRMSNSNSDFSHSLALLFRRLLFHSLPLSLSHFFLFLSLLSPPSMCTFTFTK